MFKSYKFQFTIVKLKELYVCKNEICVEYAHLSNDVALLGISRILILNVILE